MSPRRVKGEGSVFQKCEARYGCPPRVDGIRPAHKCKGRYFYAVDLGGAQNSRDRRTVSAPTLAQLRPKMRALDEKVRAGINADGSVTFGWWLHWWLAEIAPGTAKSPTTRRTYAGYIDNWIVPELGHQRLDRLKPDHFRALYKKMRDNGKTPATIRQVHAIIAKALTVAENDGKILRNPAKSASPPKGDKGTHGTLTFPEAKRLLATIDAIDDPAARGRWYAALLLGMRQGEVLGLAWDDLDFDQGIVRIRQAQKKDGGKLVLGPVKSQASRRVLPLWPKLAEALHDSDRAGPLVWGPKDNRKDWKEWQELLDAAGLERRPLHAARSGTASILDELGYSSKQIAEYLGHARATTTEDHYIKSDLERQRQMQADMGQRLLES